MKLKSLLIVFCIGTTNLQAQQYDSCDKLLETDIRNRYENTNLHSFRAYLAELITLDEAQLQNLKSSGSTSIGIPIPIGESFVNASFANDDRKERIAALRRKYSHNSSGEITNVDFESLVQDVVSPDALSTWRDCIKLSSQKQNSISYTISSPSSDVFSITFRYTPNEESDPKSLTVSQLIVTGGATLSFPRVLKPNIKMNRYTGYTQTFKRTDRLEAVSIELNLEGSKGASVELPALKRAETIPVGTIIASVLPWATYASVVDNDSQFDPVQNTWAPCDGRSIAGSDLASRGMVLSPDLRGKFLRGLNSFASDEPTPVDPNMADVDTNRTVNSYQSDTFQNHIHQLGVGATDKRAQSQHESQKQRFADFQSPSNSPRVTSPPKSISDSEQVRLSDETRPKNIAVYYYIRIN